MDVLEEEHHFIRKVIESEIEPFARNVSHVIHAGNKQSVEPRFFREVARTFQIRFS